MFGYTFFKRSALRACAVSQLADLTLIQQPDVNLVYWDRILTSGQQDFFQSLLPEFTGFQGTVDAAEIDAFLRTNLLREVGGGAEAAAWADELVAATQVFLSLTRAQRAQIIVKKVADDACRKFHTDRYDLRLFCTYVGKGTEWLADAYVNRKALVTGTNEEIVRDWTQVKRLAPGQIAIFQGEASSENRNKGIVHRSPPIEREGGQRIIFRVDPV
jgi:hypothetical protein